MPDSASTACRSLRNRPPLPSQPAQVEQALTGYARAFERLLAGYYILDRNYNYDFHNELFLRSTPLASRLPRAWGSVKWPKPRRSAARRIASPIGDALVALVAIRWVRFSKTCARMPPSPSTARPSSSG